jgi:hypothetical protein
MPLSRTKIEREKKKIEKRKEIKDFFIPRIHGFAVSIKIPSKSH